jgi:succinoglycan biosynthesis transport protein ExoP
MSVEFRQRTPSEYAQILWRRKWLIVLPAVAVACAVGWVVWSLPNIYESTTLLTVKRPTIPTVMVPSISEEDLSMRINNINQQVQSRSSLEPLILKYGLYKEDRARGVTMEEIVDRMRNHIRIEIENSEEHNSSPAFRIAFKGRDPQTTKAVTSELANKYVNAQAEDAQGVAKQTQKFFETQAAEAKKELDDIENNRLDYMIANVNRLPSSVAALIGQLTGLREQQKTLLTEIGRMRDMRSLLTRQLGDYQEQSARDNTEVAEEMADPKKTQTYGMLLSQKAGIEAELQEMRTTLTEKNPDLKRKQAQLDSIKREMANMETDATAKVERYRTNSEGRANLGAKRIGYEIEKLEREIARHEGVMATGDAQIGELQTRINSVPDVEVALESMNRDYQTKKGLYDQLLEKKSDADLSATVQINAQGETIVVVDPANLPQRPVAPKRLTLVGLGLCLGLGVGVMLALLVEVPRLLTIQTVDDASHYSGLPVLASVPDLLTPQEARNLPQRRMLWLAAGIVATIVSIPLLALALKLSHLFDRFVT